MARYHGKVLDAARGMLLAALVVAPGAAFADGLFSESARNAMLGDFWENVDVAYEEQALLPQDAFGAGRSSAPDDGSVVYLLAIYSDGSSNAGTGTVIRGEDGLNRVLTAGHVVPIRDTDDEGQEISLYDVIAFSTEGKALASLDYVVTGYDGLAPPSDDATIFDIMADVAVLEPVLFDTSEASAYWKTLGVGVASSIPNGLIVAGAGPDSPIMNAGVSGSSVRNAAGEVIGIISYSFMESDGRRHPGGSEFLTRVAGSLDVKDPFYASEFIDGLNADVAADEGGDRVMGAIGVGAPLLQREILEALHITPPTPTAPAASFTAHVAGFPDHEMRSATVEAFAISSYEIPHHIGSGNIITQEPLDGMALIGPYDAVTDPLTGVIQLNPIIIRAEPEAEPQLPNFFSDSALLSGPDDGPNGS